MEEPKIRFKGFQEEWKKKNIGSSCSISIGEFVIKTKQRANAPYPVYNGGSTNTGYYDQYNQIGPKVIVSARGANAGFVNKEEGKYWAGNSCYSIGTKDETNWLFLYYAFKFYQDKYIKAQQAANIPSVSKSDIQKTILLFPSINEQQSIASYFQHLDSLIQSTTKKIESLKQVKVASLQSMFPQEGETTPRVRFKGFEGEWEETLLGTIFLERCEYRPNAEMLSVTMNQGVIKASDNGRFDNSNSDKSKYKLVKVDDIAYNSMRMWQGACGCSKYEGIVSPAYTVIVPKEDICPSFFSYMFKTNGMLKVFRLNSQGLTSDTWNLKYPAFSKLSIIYPKVIAEQRAIASYFTNLDRQITLHTQRLEKLKQIKAACLDNMFV